MEPTKEQIKQLKANEKPFGLMSGELQEAFGEIGRTNFKKYGCAGIWSTLVENATYTQDYTYRLRPDYKPESGIVEIRIYDEGNERYFEDEGEPVAMRCAVNSKNFIGFKYADNFVCGSPVMYSIAGITNYGYYASLSDLESGVAHVLHATHVLFREVAK